MSAPFSRFLAVTFVLVLSVGCLFVDRQPELHTVVATDTDDMTKALARLLGDTAERRRILNAAPKILARYSWNRAARETLAVLQDAGQKSR